MSKSKPTNRKTEKAVLIRDIVFVGSALKDLKALPQVVRDAFAVALTAAQHNQVPTLDFKHLHVSKGNSAIELKINGRPAYRVVYTTKAPGKVHVLYAGKKTAQGTDRQLIETVEARLKSI